ncbi:Major Facilitator Superfamily protein [Calidithermus terrae]|uniref:Major Facilitator Superfamily protein n=2 Tax=Calidithermus terrae TaxID=1408545 RepID=A0A399ENV3_9DEIN|nr:Major Facilitator Superfamily protein [Calidithermus terrae]
MPRFALGNPDLRAFSLPRGLLALAGIADPFYAVYALKVLGVPGAMVGTFLMVLAAISPLSNVVWSRLVRRYGSRRVIRLATFIQVFTPLTALLMPHGAGMAYALVFVCASRAGPGIGLGYTNYMLNVAPAEERSRYPGAVNYPHQTLTGSGRGLRGQNHVEHDSLPPRSASSQWPGGQC